jgi:hypothetical protein
MAKPTNRATLIDYCKRALGDPVIEINVDEDQLDDRVDQALDYFQEFHSDSMLRTYIKHQLTATDVTNKYIAMPANVLQVKRVLPFNLSSQGSSMFDVKYQLMLHDITNMTSFLGDVGYFSQIQQYTQLLDMTLNGHPQHDYSFHQQRVYIHGDFEDETLKADEYVVIEALVAIDTNTHTSVWNDKFLKAYATQLIKQQWGANLIKFSGMQLPGGVTMNGDAIYEQATQEILRLQEEVRLEHEDPVSFFIG